MTPVDTPTRAPLADSPPLPTGRPMGHSRCELSRVIWPGDENMFGSGKGKLILELADEVGWAAAVRHSDGHAVTASVNDMTFFTPFWAGDIVTAVAHVESTGRTSMEVGVQVSARRWQGRDELEVIAEAHLVFVAVDADGAPRPVRPVHPETDAEYAKHRAAAIRREHRRALSAALAEVALPAPR
ncbi:acyl-CoA thioesterase [Actinokineospora globicatena]|uniref:Acyl-CoA thioesterase n=1 Tax=Actinokineospora globicatena TaxID=103729 RepID=A0A9W6QLJ3_9PSEU|nr:hotdog domain-containing protein [Actinokineospora globicatena]MCP2302325.1 Acyl-CoA hydrolase [Actinokineospora globicatena]GLW76005.1 acyl-CoA thioesterase [Actinokineospora globicatena]GLW82843.1 acyl-CoA thioesterase [Actinokineospora globicatena]GLW91845.1 acyl-CoA thioesterase [Actinokineospora globicatena]